MDGEPIFFANPDELRKWLKKNHTKLQEQWIGYFKKHTGIQSITWPESVAQALCYGWIDGLRKTIDDKSYKIRFTPRKLNSHWSDVNIKMVEELKKTGQITESGLKLYENRNKKKIARAAYEQKNVSLDPKYEDLIKSNKKAWDHFNSRPPSYRKQCIWWIMSAKQEKTRMKRLNTLINSSEVQEKIPPLRWSKS